MITNRYVFLFLTATSSLALPLSAAAEHCHWRFEQGFNLLDSRPVKAIDRGAKSPTELQAKAELEADLIIGPPVKSCEERGYQLFLERFERFATAALRMKKGEERDTRLRLAIAIVRRGPESVESDQEVTGFKQMESNLGAIAQDVGITPLVQQLLDAIRAEGPPKAMKKTEGGTPDPHVSQVYVPTVPLPPWAVVSIYEIEDHAHRKEDDKIQGKIEAIINWMKSVSPKTTPK